ncbi:MAG: cupredoxin domain-containing protein [Gemmatimonadota bacterium]
MRSRAIGFLTVLVLIGCARSEDAPPRTDSLELAPTEEASPAADTTHVEATLNEWRVQLSVDTVAAGPVQFMIRNSGQVTHAFEVEGEGLEEEIDDIQAGANATLTVNLRPGTYEVYCPRDDDAGNHKAKGMTTQLIVR